MATTRWKALAIGLAVLGAVSPLVAAPLPGKRARESAFRANHAPVNLSERLNRGEKIARLRDVSKVGLGNLTSYAGFFTVDAAKASNMFFWHFPSLDSNPKAPLLIWLQGGPGASSMFSLFHEIGPFELAKDEGKHGSITLSQRALSWNDRYSLLFIDNPVGAGFSYTESVDGYPSTEEEVSANLMTLIQQFYLVFPAMAKVPLYLTGESYAGHYIPALGLRIHQHNIALDKNNPALIPLVGMAIGDGWIDPINMVPEYPVMLKEMGLIDSDQEKVFQSYCSRITAAIKGKFMNLAFAVWDEMINGDLFPYPSLFVNVTGMYDYDNNQNTQPPASFSLYSQFLDSPETRKALHVGTTPFGLNSSDAEKALQADFMRSMVPELQTLIPHYKVLIYSGNLDIIVGAPLTEAFMSKLVFNGSVAFHAASRTPYKTGGANDPEVAGYVKHAGNLTQLIVRGAGHILPHDQASEVA
jgi:vitellogenic carboxypeptidase-like protein